MNELTATDAKSASETNAFPVIERHRHELKRRELTVTTVEHVTPNMLRITLASDDLADFTSAAPDDHIKIFLDNGALEPDMRDYTPRRFDSARKELVLDFAIHEAGPATAWALAAKPGGTLRIGGPRGSAVISGVTSWLLIGDETALPAIGRRIEELAVDHRATVVATVENAGEEQTFESAADVSVTYVHRPLDEAANATSLIAALDTLEIQPRTFAWIAAEASVARAVRTYLVEQRGHSLQWLKAAGYWTRGKADAHEKIE